MSSEKKFDNSSSGSFQIPDDSTVLDSRVTSYSGARWVNRATLNNITFYNLSKYNIPYIELGDPYVLNIPISILSKNNIVSISTGVSSSNFSTGSENNKVILTVVKNATGYSKISSSKNGCRWTIQFEDYSNITIDIPQSYLGIENCYYQQNSIIYNQNDATQNAVFDLLEVLDLNKNNKVDVKFTEQQLRIELSEIVGIPYTWATEVQIRTWY